MGIKLDVITFQLSSKQVFMDWLTTNVYLRHRETVGGVMGMVEAVCKDNWRDSNMISINVEEQYAATIHRRGLKIMTIYPSDDPSKILGQIALFTAIPSGVMTEYIVGVRRENLALKLDGLQRVGSLMNRDDFRAWLTLKSNKVVGQELWRQIETHLIERNLINSPLYFRQGNYRRRPSHAQRGVYKVDMLMEPDVLLASMKIHTDQVHQPYRMERLIAKWFEFEFNPEVFTQPEEASNMSKQDNAAQTSEVGSNMMQAGKRLEYLSMWEPIKNARPFSYFEDWLKRNTSSEFVYDTVKHLVKQNLFGKYQGFMFKEVNHPKLDDLEEGKESFGDITFWCLPTLESQPLPHVTDEITFIVGAKQNEDKSAWVETLVGVPEAEAVEFPPATDLKPVEKFRPSAFGSLNENANKDGLKLLDQGLNTLMTGEEFVQWMTRHAANKERLNDAEVVRQLVVKSPAIMNRDPVLDLRFYVHVRQHAQNKTAVVGDEETGIAGVLDVVAVERASMPLKGNERRQVALFSFKTYPTLVPAPSNLAGYPTSTAERVLSYISPTARSTIHFTFDEAQVYTFHQFADILRGMDPEGAEQLTNYQLEVRNILRRLYGQEAGSTLYLKAMRLYPADQRNTGMISAGQISISVYDKYQQIDEGKALLTFSLITGLQSDTLLDRNVELVQACECEVAEEFDRQMKGAREEARTRTLEAVGLVPKPISMKHAYPVAKNFQPVEAKAEATPTTIKTASFAFFKGAVGGLFPLLQTTEADRVEGFLEHLGNEYVVEGEHQEVFEASFINHDHLAIVVTEKDKVTYCMDLLLK